MPVAPEGAYDAAPVPTETQLALLALIPLTLLCGWIARSLKVRSLRKRLRQPLADVPEALVQSWRHSMRKPQTQTGLSCSEVLFQLSRIDRSALAAYAPKQVPQSFDELLVAWRQASPSVDPEKLKQEQAFALAHRGELLLAEHLREQGHDVQLSTAPSESTHAGWSATVDGHGVQLIASLEVETIQNFVDQNDGVPVVTLSDHTRAFVDHAMVMALEPVSAVRAGLISSAEPTDDPAPDARPVSANESGPPDQLDPVSQLGKLVLNQAASPLLLGVFQSAQLAAQGNKDWVAAATNNLTDQAGSAVGGWAGARAGALAGGLFGPLGAAAGGWLGGLLGKKFGAGLVLKKKEKKLRKLLSTQEGFLSQLPKAANHALAKHAEHLAAVADSIAPRSERSFWPSPGLLSRQEVANQYRAWSKAQALRARKLSQWLAREHSEKALTEQGIKLLNVSIPWSDKMLELRAELLFIAAQIEEERARIDQGLSARGE